MKLNTIVCGDCLELMRGMDDNSVDLVLTDPPYNINFKYDAYVDTKTDTAYVTWCRNWFSQLKRISNIIVITVGTMNMIKWLSIEEPQKILMWYKKNSMTGAKCGGINAWEPILIYGNKKDIKIGFDVIECLISHQKDIGNHPCPKPIKLFRELLLKLTKENDIILDPFLGSGTTAVACKQLHRNYIGIEISPEYCKIANNRLAQGVLDI